MFSRAAIWSFWTFSLFFLVGADALSTSATAQTNSAEIRGRVHDQDGAKVAGARVSLRQDDPDLHVSTIADEGGEFVIQTKPGVHKLLVAGQGFSDWIQSLDLRPGEVRVLDIGLQIADTTAIVTITDSPSYLAQSITSATKTTSQLRDIPQSISVVSSKQIKEQSIQNIADAITYVPGVSSHQGENNRDQVIFRGNSSSADFYVNGVRDDVQYYRDLYNVESLEILKGPSSMIFGRGGGGGVLNRTTKQAGFSSFKEFTAQVGSFGNKRFTTDLDQAVTQKVALRGNALYEHSDSFRRFVGLERYGINPTITWIAGNKTALTASYEFFHDRRVADRGIPSFQLKPADTPIDTYFGDPDNSRVNAKVNLASIHFEQNAGRFNIRNRTTFGDYDRFYQNYVPGAVTSDKTQVALSSYNNSTKRRNLFNQSDIAFDFQTQAVKHSFLLGAEIGHQSTHNFRNTGFFNDSVNSILIPYESPRISIPVTFRQRPTDANNHVTTRLVATYLQDQIEFSRKLLVVTGLRFDYFDLNFHNNRNDEDLRRIDQLVSPRLGLIIRPYNALSLYANYAVAYLPSSGDQFSSLTIITQQLKPEKFRNYEVGVKWELRPRLAFTAAWYRQDRTNTRSNDPNDPTRIVQTGSQRTNGVEFELTGNVTQKWSVLGGYSYQDAFITHDTTAARAGAQVAQVPHQTLSLWNNYQVWRRLSVGLGLIHRTDMFAAIDNTVVLPGYTRADTAIFYTIGEHWQLQANLQNLFDTRYYLNADNNNNISPGSSRGLRFGLTARF